MSKITELEDALRADPTQLGIRAELHQELVDQLGYSAEEAHAHVEYVWIMARRAQQIARAAELIRDGSPTRLGLLQAALTWVNLESITQAAFHVVTDGVAPTVEDRPRTVAGAERVVVVRVPATWLIDTHEEMNGRQARRPRRPEGGA